MAVSKAQEKTNLELFKKMQKSPIFTIEALWNLKPQSVKPEHEEFVEECIENGNFYKVEAKHFDKFVKKRHISWQQFLILRAVENAISGKAQKRITVRSGHGIGKSTTMAWLVIWYLLFYKDSQVPCTAPTGDQLFDVLWKEIAKWIEKFPDVPWLKDKLEWQSSYIRNAEAPQTWFARARTARKESPEALAGIHGDYVMMIVDEASGVADEIFNVAEGALTEKNTLIVMISNPTRLQGYFYESHTADQDSWQCLNFSSNDSPIVDDSYTERIISKNGEDSDEYRIRVLGEFPRADAVDDKGYVPLLMPGDIRHEELAQSFTGHLRMGVDPAGEGIDETRWVVRDKFRARVVAREKISNPQSIAQKTLTLMTQYNILGEAVWIDNFGVGADVNKYLGLAGVNANGINVGERANDKDLFLNKRAEAYTAIRKWILGGGEVCKNEDWKELTHVRYRRGLSGRIQMMSKREMRSAGYKSPNTADALMLTFIEKEDYEEKKKKKNKKKQFKPNYKQISYNRY